MEEENINWTLAQLLGYKRIKIEKGSCGGIVHKWIEVKDDHTLQTADWYANEYWPAPAYSIYYWAMLEAEHEARIVKPKTFAERKRARIWLAFWVGKNVEPTFTPLEMRVRALIHALQKLPLTTG